MIFILFFVGENSAMVACYLGESHPSFALQLGFGTTPTKTNSKLTQKMMLISLNGN
jgi:hypothetical protein